MYVQTGAEVAEMGAEMGCKGDLKRSDSGTASDVWREVTAPIGLLAVDRRAPGIAAARVSRGRLSSLLQ